MRNAAKILAGLVICLVLTLIFIFFNNRSQTTVSQEQPTEITGSLETAETDVNVKVPGRVADILVDEGDTVVAGQTLAVLEADNIKAKSQLAAAALEAARAQYRKAKNGARPQQLQQAKDLMDQAKVAYDLAQSTYNRLTQLYNDGVLPEQKLDVARTELTVAQRRYNSAKEQYNMVKEGAQQEDIEAAAALVRQAEAGYAEVQTYLNDATVKAPTSGTITLKAVDNGELVSTGMPLVTISDLSQIWLKVKVRETAIAQFSVGQKIPVRIAAMPGRAFQGKIVYIAAKPSFATERAYQEKGEKDLVAFEVKIKLDNSDLKLRPGMTGIVSLKD